MISLKDVQTTLRAVLVVVPGLPAAENRVWENAKEYKPVSGIPYVTDSLAPSTTKKYTTSPAGLIESRGLYLVQWFGVTGSGLGPMRDGADAILAAFPPGRGFPMSSGLTVRVRGDQAPVASQIMRISSTDFSYVTVTIPWQVFWRAG